MSTVRLLVRVGSVVVLAALVGCAPKAGAPAASGTAPTPAPSSTSTLPPEPVPQAGAAPTTAETASAEGPAGLDDAAAMLTTRDAARSRDALARLQDMLARNPGSADIHYNIGLAHLQMGNEVDARKSWLRTTQIDPTYARAFVNLAALSARHGQYQTALGDLESGVRAAPQDLELRVAMIGVLRRLKRNDDAIAQAKAALSINARSLPVYTALAEVYLDTNQLDLARFSLEKALIDVDGAEGNARLHADLGLVALRQGFPGDAIPQFERALQLDPNQIVALGELGNHYLDNRDYAAAEPLFARLVALQADAAGPRLSHGIALRGLGRYDDARKAYDEARRLDPSNPEPLRNIAVLQGEYLHDYAACLSTIEEYRRAGGNPAEVDAWAAAVKKDQEKAEKKKKRDLEQQPKPQPAPDAPANPTPAPGGDTPWGGGGR